MTDTQLVLHEMSEARPPVVTVTIGSGLDARVFEVELTFLLPDADPETVTDHQILSAVEAHLEDELTFRGMTGLPRGYIVNRATRASDGVASSIVGEKPEFG